jgi:hypothetical protein
MGEETRKQQGKETARGAGDGLFESALHDKHSAVANQASTLSTGVIPRSVRDEESLRIQQKRGRLRCLSDLRRLIPKRFFAALRMTHGERVFVV